MTTSDLRAQIAARTAAAITEARDQLANGWTDTEVLAVARDAWGPIQDLKDHIAAAEELKLEMLRPGPYVCTCEMTDPKTWLSAASCGYGSGYEPGSQWELDPECPQHGWDHEWCETCEAKVPIVESFDDQIGFEEQARYVVVTRLDCGHELVVPARFGGSS